MTEPTQEMIDAAVENCALNTGKNRVWIRQWMTNALRAALDTQMNIPPPQPNRCQSCGAHPATSTFDRITGDTL